MKHKTLVIVISVSLLATMLIALFSLFYATQVEHKAYPEELPDGTPAIRVIKSSQAVSIMKKIHWSPSNIPVKDAIIVQYASGARLWIALVGSSACKAVRTMAERMTKYENRLPYTTPAQHNLQGRIVYLSLDKRNSFLHAFWCVGEKVVWIELPPQQAKLLTEIVKEVK